MTDRRRLKRRHLMFYTRIYDKQTGELLGYLADLTEDGAMLISEKPIETARSFQLRMDLPTGAFSKEWLSFGACSVWCQADLDPHLYNTGFQLEQISPEDLGIIQSIVEGYGLREQGD